MNYQFDRSVDILVINYVDMAEGQPTQKITFEGGGGDYGGFCE